MGKNVPNRAGMHDPNHPGNIARSGAPKRAVTQGPSPVHDGMRSRVMHNGQLLPLTGQTETSLRAVDATGRETMASAVSAEDRFKRLTPPTPAFGMRSRSREVSPGDKGHVPDLQALGRAVLNQAVLSGSTKLRSEGDL
jgi:hypothetical protein